MLGWWVIEDTTYLRNITDKILLTSQTRKARFESHCHFFYCWIEGWLCNKDTIFYVEEGGRDHHLFCGLVGPVRI